MRKAGVLLAIAALSALVLLYSQSSPSASVPPTGRLKVAATFFPLYDFASKVGGERVEVQELVPHGVEPHDWEPKAGDVLKILNARVVVYIGAGFEPWLPKAIDASGAKSRIIEVEAAKGITLEKSDPHIWLDPILAKEIVKKIRDAFIQADPINANYYSANAESYLQKLDQLDAAIRKSVSKFATTGYIAFHQAFTYFNKRYGLQLLAVIEESPGREPSAAWLAEIVQLTRKHNVKVIFSEPMLDPKAAEVISKEVGGRVLTLDPIEGVSEEDLREGKDYISIMRQNLENLAVALR